MSAHTPNPTNPQSEARKPYMAPRLVQHGRVEQVTRQITPTTTTPPGSQLGEFEEF